MKKGDIVEIYIEEEKYPCKGIGYADAQRVIVDDCFKEQGIRAVIKKKRSDYFLAEKMSVIKKAPYENEPFCPQEGRCGGCVFQKIPYDRQLERKGREVLKQLKDNGVRYERFLGVESSVKQTAYRNKMEYSFGDETPKGEMTLGMHKKNSFMSVVTTDECKLVPKIFNDILKTTLSFCKERRYPAYHKKTHTGLMRNLIVRRGERTGEILINIVTGTQGEFDEDEYVKLILKLRDKAAKDDGCPADIKGVLHTIDDDPADAVNPQSVKLLWGCDYFHDEIMGLSFKISPFSFFQPNTLTAEKLYVKALELAGELKDKTVFDLYSGTGSLSQIMALRAKHVTGIEIVEEAVLTARENVKRNRLDNCTFIAEDVYKALDSLKMSDTKPDIIVLDPPRGGILPRALERILDCDAAQIIYISCNPATLAANLFSMQSRGYCVRDVKAFDQFPHTKHVECVVSMSKVEG